MLSAAYLFAANQHASQRRKNTKADPYINHPIEVANFVARAGGSQDAIIAAILHDTVEDTGATYEQIEQLFGANVANIVRQVSDDKSLDKVARKRLQIEHARDASVDAQIVKMADKLSNLSSLHDDPPQGWSPEVVQGYAVWSHAVLRDIRHVNEWLSAELGKVLAQFGITIDSAVDQDALEAYYAKI